jgi:hypothetical protein
MNAMISGERALEIARRELAGKPWRSDPLFDPWKEASLQEPILVRDVFKTPSYWVVPVLLEGRVAGFIRILGEGEVAALGAFYQRPEQIKTCPQTFPALNAGEAKRQAQERVSGNLGETMSEPVFVHDGPPGREAWLIEVFREDKPSRWIFVTPGFIYERQAGELLDENLE